MTSATIHKASGTDYAERISAALNTALLRHEIVARVGMRQQDNLLYVALEPLLAEGESAIAVTAVERHPNAAALLPFLQQTLMDVRSQLQLEWVKLTKVSGRLPGQPLPLWQDDLLIDSPQAPGDVSVSIGGNLSGQLIIGDNNQAYNYTYNVEHGGVLNVAAPPTIKLRPMPLSIKPRPFKQLLDRQTVLPILRSTLEQMLPVEVFAEPGFGKTTLMRHLAHDAQMTAGFADGVVYLAVHQQQADDVLQSLYDIFYEASPPFKPSYGQVQQSLRGKQALIILNGLSLKTEEMGRLLDAMPACGFVLVSEERIYWQDGAAIALEGLPFPESIALMQKELGRALSEAEQVVAKSLWTSLKGNPLQLRRSAAQVQVQAEENKKAVLNAVVQSAQAATPGPVSQQSLAQLCLTQLSKPQRAALGLMGAMGGVALSGGQAQAIAQAPETATALAELADLHLVEATGNGYQICDDLIETVQQAIDPEPWLTKATDYFVSDFASDLASEGASLAEPGSTDAMLHLMDWTQGTQQWQQSIELAKHLDQPLSTSGQWAQWETVLNNCLRAAEQSGNGHAEAWSLHQLGTRSLAMGNAAQADGWLARSLWLREQLGDVAGSAITRHNLGFITPPLVMVEGAPVATALVEGAAQVATSGSSRVLPWVGAVGGLLLAGAAGLALLPSPDPIEPEGPAVIEEVVVPVEIEEPAADAPLALTFNPVRLAFGETLLEQANRQALSVRNGGEEPVDIAALELLGEQASSFAVVDKSCGGKTLLPRASCQLDVVFTPKAAGEYAAQLRVTNEASEGRSLNLTGTGKAPAETTTKPKPPSPTPSPTPPSGNGEEPQSPTELSAADDIDSVDSGSSVVIDVLANDVVADGDGPLTIVEVSEPEDGTAAISEGGIVYSHRGEGVRDRFTYTVQDSKGNQDTALVAITVIPRTEPSPAPPTPPDPEDEQQPPSVTNYQIELQAGDSPRDVNLLENATDPNPNDVLRVLRVANNPHEGGELVNNGDGTVTYIPAPPAPPVQVEGGVQYVPDYRNNFEFEITDDQGGTAIATLYVTVVNPVPEVPDVYEEETSDPYDDDPYDDDPYEGEEGSYDDEGTTYDESGEVIEEELF